MTCHVPVRKVGGGGVKVEGVGSEVVVGGRRMRRLGMVMVRILTCGEFGVERRIPWFMMWPKAVKRRSSLGFRILLNIYRFTQHGLDVDDQFLYIL